jgi:hypothetical protein
LEQRSTDDVRTGRKAVPPEQPVIRKPFRVVLRRGLATNLHRLGVDGKTIQTLLRHSSVHTTREIYIKGVEGDAVARMKQLEAAIQPVRPN